MAFMYSFTPEDRYAEYHARRKKRAYKKRIKNNVSWKAPEHAKLTTDMGRDFPRDDLGVPLKGSKRDVLVLDPRPQVLKPERPTYAGF
jgi:hypothetical protein